MVTPLKSMELERTSDTRFTGVSAIGGAGRPVFGGQLLGQAVMIGSAVDSTKFVRSVHVVFPRMGDPAKPLTFDIEPVHAGRTMSTLGVNVTQDGGSRLVCRATLLIDTEEEDVMAHGSGLPEEAGQPLDWAVSNEMTPDGAEVRIVGNADADTPHPSGRAEILAWVRWPDAPRGDRARNAAIGSWCTDSQLIGAAMRTHPDVTIGMAHVEVSTGVLTHSMSYHQPSNAADWHLIVNTSTFAGGGRVYGHGTVVSEDGRHVASFAQDGMVRWFAESETRRGSGVM